MSASHKQLKSPDFYREEIKALKAKCAGLKAKIAETERYLRQSETETALAEALKENARLKASQTRPVSPGPAPTTPIAR
ncbi:hypothetical protein [Stenotrophomonas pavanii]|uniref:hypothetical protein n=1 Tax=Stenotrophomonas pavanii TaxID=487698 RepID=UPI0039C60777